MNSHESVNLRAIRVHAFPPSAIRVSSYHSLSWEGSALLWHAVLGVAPNTFVITHFASANNAGKQRLEIKRILDTLYFLG